MLAAPVISVAPAGSPPARTLGLAALARLTLDAEALMRVWGELVARFEASGFDAGALFDIATLLLATGQREKGLELQAAALEVCRQYRRPAPGGAPELRLLVICAAGDLMANTPVDFLLEGSRVEPVWWFVDGPPDPALAPPHDVALIGISESPQADGLLHRLQGAFEAWPAPVLNNRPALIAGLTRDGVAARFAGHAHILAPTTVRASREAMAAAAAGGSLSGLAAGLEFPVIVRPIGSQAGVGLERLANPADLAAYLAGRSETAFFVARFIDYAGPDGLYRKYRVAFIGGRPFISHMAVSPRWMIHYLNADMAENPANRAEEAAVMAGFEAGFAHRHAAAFAALNAAYPLDYWAIDCAEAPDGRLLLFEADTAMIVHAMDPADVYPYKQPAMARLFAAFVAELAKAAA
ncbi:hypothetical protein [Phenylobacterium sp.]|uniref:ATP-grasp domain-containing protein n=1 Tax=Phenylobacterium sp. TaxID=1871053 RepID=UPI00262E42A8|nr:hypothetical protein [Phenylobacterium sp.]